MHYFFLCWKFKLLFLLSTAFFPFIALIFSAAAAVYFASRSAACYWLYCSRLGMLESVKLNLQELVKGVYPAYFNKISFLIDISAQSKIFETLSFIFIFYAAIAAIAYIIRPGATARTAYKRMLIVSAVFLCAGLFAPLLAIKAVGDIPVIGGSGILKFESKGIIETIIKLYGGSYYLPAFLITLFSVAFPVAKIILCYLALNSGAAARRSRALVKLIGKWSMADVFTVSIILAYLAFGADKFTSAWLLSGFYFFCAYCLISLAATNLFADAAEEEEVEGKFKNINGA
jgi:uncharacterized paraquat-inducible protein A